jgi:L-ascorbate metabolism protein UlaG (beta-lactamase superfamily)
MKLTRRDSLQLAGAAALGAFGSTLIMPFVARAQNKGDIYKGETGEIVVSPVEHASFMMTVPGLVIYNDPVGGKDLYAGHPAPGLVLITHEHGDHFDVPTLQAIIGPDTKLVVNPAVHAKLPPGLQAKATAIANGENATVGPVEVQAIPAYNTTEERKKFHPQGRDNGYVLITDGRRVYIAGDTEDIPEMRALTGIDIAFVPMNLPYTMDIDQASSAVAAFKPAVVYPYHYNSDAGPSDVNVFAEKVGTASKVVLGKWYS